MNDAAIGARRDLTWFRQPRGLTILTTVAAWFLAIFTGSPAAGAVGTLWSSTPHAEFFVILALLALAAAGMLLTMDRATCRIEAARRNDSVATKLAQAPSR
jgi:hypothetical protein